LRVSCCMRQPSVILEVYYVGFESKFTTITYVDF
jgi:hypothetical protein